MNKIKTAIKAKAEADLWLKDRLKVAKRTKGELSDYLARKTGEKPHTMASRVRSLELNSRELELIEQFFDKGE